MALIKGMVSMMVGIPLMGAALGGIASAGMGGIGHAAQSLVSVGFIGHAVKASGANEIFKW